MFYLIGNRVFRTLAATLVVSLLLCSWLFSSTPDAMVLCIRPTPNSVTLALLSASSPPFLHDFLSRVRKWWDQCISTLLYFHLSHEPVHSPNVFLAQWLVPELRLARPEELRAEAAGEGVRVPAPLEAARLHGGRFLVQLLHDRFHRKLYRSGWKTLPWAAPDWGRAPARWTGSGSRRSSFSL